MGEEMDSTVVKSQREVEKARVLAAINGDSGYVRLKRLEGALGRDRALMTSVVNRIEKMVETAEERLAALAVLSDDWERIGEALQEVLMLRRVIDLYLGEPVDARLPELQLQRPREPGEPEQGLQAPHAPLERWLGDPRKGPLHDT